MSGLTSTGLTVAQDASNLPSVAPVVALDARVGRWGSAWCSWRSRSSNRTPSRSPLYTTEINVDELAEKHDNPVRSLWIVYGGLTIFSIGLLWLAGMPLWEALNHGLTGIATGGFTVTSDSFRSYAPVVKSAGIVVIILGAIDFVVHVKVFLRGQGRQLGRDTQTVALWIALVAGGLFLTGINRIWEEDWLVLDSLFQWVSALGTCGFNSVQVSSWGSPALLLLVAGMFVGAAAGSTGGGIKLRRAALLLKGVVWQVRERDDRTERRHRFGGEELDEEKAFRLLRQASVLATLFLLSLFLGTLALLLLIGERYTLMELLFEAASALGSVGLSAGVTGPDTPAPAKAVLITLMWLGRLEVMAVLVIFAELLTPLRPHRAEYLSGTN